MGKLIGEGSETLVCTSVLGTDRAGIMAELAAVLAKGPDVVEWRADFFSRLADTGEVLAIAREMKAVAPGTTMIFTIRSAKEGGEEISLTDREAIELRAEICRRSDFEYVDCELINSAEDLAYLRSVAAASGTRIIASYHNFDHTPDPEVLLGRFAEAQRHGMDVAKVAVMPRGVEDVLTLLGVTLEGRKRSAIPLITMSMGGTGAVSRMIGGVFGSSLTFAVGERSSAPGQVPIGELRTVLDIVKKSI